MMTMRIPVFMPRPYRIVRCLKILALVALGAVSCQGGTTIKYTWLNAGSDWNSEANWAPPGFPGTDRNDVAIFHDAAIINPRLSDTVDFVRMTTNRRATGYKISGTDGASLRLSGIGRHITAVIRFRPSGEMTIAAPVVLDKRKAGEQFVNVEDPSGVLRLTGGVSSTYNVSLVKEGSGTLELSGPATHTGNIVVFAGTVHLAEAGELTFYVGRFGVNNQLTGSGAATALLDGAFTFDLSGASTEEGASWSIVDAGALKVRYGPAFTVTDFEETGDGRWRGSANGAVYRFDSNSGSLSVVSGD
jgi:autotransporter-associated beta strand protein